MFDNKDLKKIHQSLHEINCKLSFLEGFMASNTIHKYCRKEKIPITNSISKIKKEDIYTITELDNLLFSIKEGAETPLNLPKALATLLYYITYF